MGKKVLAAEREDAYLCCRMRSRKKTDSKLIMYGHIWPIKVQLKTLAFPKPSGSSIFLEAIFTIHPN
jgi:hypothetical protein